MSLSINELIVIFSFIVLCVNKFSTSNWDESKFHLQFTWAFTKLRVKYLKKDTRGGLRKLSFIIFLPSAQQKQFSKNFWQSDHVPCTSNTRNFPLSLMRFLQLTKCLERIFHFKNFSLFTLHFENLFNKRFLKTKNPLKIF